MEQPITTPITVRRNPPRRARATSALKPHHVSPTLHVTTSPLPLPEPLYINPKSSDNRLRVFLRIRPCVEVKVRKGVGGRVEKKVRRKEGESCVRIDGEGSVTLFPPRGLVEVKRAKSEVFEGFESVFSADSSQVEVFDKMVKPLVDDFLRGKSGMLAALGPSGSGKTHTVFGTPREPGMVPQALGQIFNKNGLHKTQSSRTFYLSMFEICSEKGKAERLCDLLQDGGDLSLQQSAIKGLQEVLIPDVQQAECFIARGMLKRATANTNSNSQSSRSQCIINIRTVESKINEVDCQMNCAMLTIVDLAGAERERKTGNQGARLLESNFINNTSMVFGLCLRSLLEHQKNPKKPLQKHFQSSLLTRYLREYLEGKKRMALILTVKSGEEDYLDSSLLLRQASPYMKIKFDNIEESLNLICTKRQKQALPRTEERKRMKITSEECVDNSGKGVKDQLQEEEACEKEGQNRNHMIMQNFAKAIWKVLKEYKMNLEVAENQIRNLTGNLAEEKARRSELETELKDLKRSLSCRKENAAVREESLFANGSAKHIGSQEIDDVHDSNSFDASSSFFDASESQGKSCQEMELKDVKGPHSCQIEASPVHIDRFSASRSVGQDGIQEIDDLRGLHPRLHSQEQSYQEQVIGNQIQITTNCLANENAAGFELEIDVKDEESPVSRRKGASLANGGSAFCYKTKDQEGYQEIDDLHDSASCNASSSLVDNLDSQQQSNQYQVTENQIQYARESFSYQIAEPSEFEKELKNVHGSISFRNEMMMVNEDSSFSNKWAEQDRFNKIDDVHDLETRSPSSSIIDISESQGKSSHYQCTDKEVEGFLEDIDSSEALKNLTDAGKDDNLFKVSGPLQHLTRSPEILTPAKENICHSAVNNERRDEKYEVAENQIHNARESHADKSARCSELEVEVRDVKYPLSCTKELSSVNKDGFLGSKSAEREGFQEFGDVHVSESCGASSSVVDFNIQGQSSENQCTAKEIGGSSGEVDCSEALQDLSDAGKEDSQFRVSGNSLPQMSLLETLAIRKENICHSDVEKERHDDEYKENPYRSTKAKEANFHPDCDIGKTLKSEKKTRSTCKRRLVPDSSILLRDQGGLNIEDKNEKPKCTGKEIGSLPGEVDSSEALKNLSDTGIDDNQCKVSRDAQPFMSLPETSTRSKDTIFLPAEKNKTHDGEYKERPRRSTKAKEANFRPAFNVSNRLKSEEDSRSTSKPAHLEKPKRRLAPASSVLLRDLGGLNFDDENEKRKGTKGVKKSTLQEREITQGSLSLLRLLNKNLHL